MNLFESFVDGGLKIARKKCIQAIPQVNMLIILHMSEKQNKYKTTKNRIQFPRQRFFAIKFNRETLTKL